MKKLLVLCVLIGLIAYFVVAGVPFTGKSGGYELTIAITSGGHVEEPGEVLEVGEKETFRFDSGTVVDLRAVAESGYAFLNWTGDTTVEDEEVGEGNGDVTVEDEEVGEGRDDVPVGEDEEVGEGDGAETDWSLARKSVLQDSEKIYVHVFEQTRGVDYTIDYEEGEISFNSPPNDGALITATYCYAQTEWSLANNPVLEQSEAIYIDGVEQTRDTDYTIDYNTGEITFTTPPENGALITGDYHYAQTEWSLANNPVLEQSEAIYIDGVEQTRDTDYTIDYNTGEITFATPPEKGALITGDYHWADPTVGGAVENVTAAVTTITMDADYSLTANFVDSSSTAILTVSSTEGGSVTAPGESAFACDIDTEVDILAVADDGYTFTAWTGDVDTVDDVNAAATTITMDRDYEIIANFGADYTLNVSSSEGGSVTVPGEGDFTYGEGAITSLVAEADEGAEEYLFVNWTGDVGTIGASVEREDLGEGDGTQVEWSLANNPVLEESEAIYIDSVEQTRDTDYTIDYNTGVVSFTTAPATEDLIIADYYYLDATAAEASIVINGDYAITANFVKWVARYDNGFTADDQAIGMVIDADGNIYVTGNSYDGDDPLDPADPITDDDYLTIKYDSELNQVWAKRYNGPANGDDRPVDIAMDSAGNIYVTGKSEGSGTNYDYATVAYNSNGTQLWATRFDGVESDVDSPSAIAVDGSGNVYVTGTSRGDNLYDCVTIQYDDKGDEQWVAIYDRGERDEGYDVAVDGDGNVYVTGYSEGLGTGRDYATIKYDGATGNPLWDFDPDPLEEEPATFYVGPGSANDSASAIAVDGSGNIYVTGQSEGSNDDYVTVKYGSDGNEIWAARYDGSGGADVPSCMALDGDGNVYVTGRSQGSNSDYATIKYDNDGNEEWVARYDGEAGGSDMARAMVLDSEGNVYVTGASEVANTKPNYVTIAYDSDGNELWDNPVSYSGPVNRDYANAIVVDADGNIFVTGSSEDIYNGDDYVTVRIVQ